MPALLGCGRYTEAPLATDAFVPDPRAAHAGRHLHDDVVDGDMHQLHKEADEAHDDESHPDRLRNLDKLYTHGRYSAERDRTRHLWQPARSSRRYVDKQQTERESVCWGGPYLCGWAWCIG